MTPSLETRCLLLQPLTGEGEFVSGRLPQEVWELTAAEWRARELDGLELVGRAPPEHPHH